MATSREELLREMRQPSLWQRLSAADWAWLGLVALATVATYAVLWEAMNHYEVVITAFTAATMVGLSRRSEAVGVLAGTRTRGWDLYSGAHGGG